MAWASLIPVGLQLLQNAGNSGGGGDSGDWESPADDRSFGAKLFNPFGWGDDGGDSRRREIRQKRERAERAAAERRAKFDELSRQLKEHYKPYEEAGLRSMPVLEKEYGSLVNKPEALLGRLENSFNYKESPGYKFQLGEALRAANQAASAGGTIGSPTHQHEAMRVATGLASKEYYPQHLNYLSNALGLYSSGLRGHEGLRDTGFSSTNNSAEGQASLALSGLNLDHASAMNAENRRYTANADDLQRRRTNSSNLTNMFGNWAGNYLQNKFGGGVDGYSGGGYQSGGGGNYGGGVVGNAFSQLGNRPDQFWSSSTVVPNSKRYPWQ
jgi:hypothetical protein